MTQLVPPPDADVLVVGAGPCGVTMANLLGSYGVRTILVERERDILDYPRAVGLDDESLRTFQAVGLVDEVLADVIQNSPIRYHTSWGRCFAHVKPTAQPFGWPRRNQFLQPMLEETLRRGLARFGNVDVRYGWELEALSPDDSGVTARVIDGDGEAVSLRASYVVGTDGGRSTVRRLIGVELTGRTAPDKWLVVDVADDQLDAPYSAVYCDPQRPVLMVPLPYRHRRFEFRLTPGDDEEDMSRPENVNRLLAARYGDGPLPTVVRSRVYLHHSRIASSFQRGRVCLAGDAAHLQPPFFGQGLNSGLRDVTNLAWKLAFVVQGRAGPGLVDTYDVERRDHARAMVSFATRIGRLYTPHNRATERARDLGFRALNVVPGGKDYVLQMKYKPMPRYRRGVVVDVEDDPTGAVGRMFSQPVVGTADRRRVKLDDVLGAGLAVIGVFVDPAGGLGEDDRNTWSTWGARFIHVVRARAVGRPSRAGSPSPLEVPSVSDAVVEDVDGAFRDWLLDHPGAEILVLRPDRYLAAARPRHGLAGVTSAMGDVLGAQMVRGEGMLGRAGLGSSGR
jgi:3-(3-hydroxy-phenyl)propionate hydroxylase